MKSCPIFCTHLELKKVGLQFRTFVFPWRRNISVCPGITSHPLSLNTHSLAANTHLHQDTHRATTTMEDQPVLDHRRVLCRFLGGENQEICEDLVLGTRSSVFIWNNNYDRLSHNCTPKRIVFLARDKVLYSVQKRKKKRLHNYYYYYLWVLPIVTQKSWELNSCCVATIFAMNYGNSEIYILFKLNHTQFISFVPLQWQTHIRFLPRSLSAVHPIHDPKQLPRLLIIPVHKQRQGNWNAPS